MKTLFNFFLGLVVGAAGHWFFTDTETGRAAFNSARVAVSDWRGSDAGREAEEALRDLEQDAGEALAAAGDIAEDAARVVVDDVIEAAGDVDVDAVAREIGDEAIEAAARVVEYVDETIVNLPDLETLANTLAGWQQDMVALDERIEAGDEKVIAQFESASTATMAQTGFEPHAEFFKCPVIQVSNSGRVGENLALLDYTPWMTTPASVLIRAPVGAACLSSGYGSRSVNGASRNHGGVDYYSHDGVDIFASGDGTVLHAGEDGAYGYAVRIDHGNDVVSSYAHMVAGSLRVSEGDTVQLGDVIGTMGRSGRAYAVHLHYEVRFDEATVDPLQDGKRASFGG